MESLVIEKDGKFVFSSHKHSREEIVKEKAKYYWELIRGGYKQKFKIGDRVILDQYPCIVNKVEWRGDSKYVGYVYTVIGTDFGRKVKEEDLMLDPSKEETKSHNNMCKQLIDEMNPNVEANVKTKPEPKFKRGDFVFSGIDFCAMKVINSCYDEHWRYQIFDDVNEYWFFEKELKKVEIGDVVYSKVWKEKVIVRDFCDDKFILVANFKGKLLKSLPSLIKQIKEETKPKSSNTVSVDKAAEVFADMLIELCPELLGFGGAAKEWENEFRKRLEE